MRHTELARVGAPIGMLIGIAAASLAIPSAVSAQTTLGASDAVAPLVQRNERDPQKTIAFTGHGVGIVSCSVDSYANVAQTTDGSASQTAQFASGIHVAFINGADTAIDSVTVLVSYAGEQRAIVDRGHFSPGITIDHRFTAFAGAPFVAEKPDSCTIASVHFENTPSLL